MKRTTTDKNAELAEGLRTQGVAEKDIEYVLSVSPSRALSILNDFLAVIIMSAGFAVGAVLWVIGAKYSDAAALEHARATSGVLYEDMFGISGLVAIFGWIFASGYIVTRPRFVSYQPARFMTHSGFSTLANTDSFWRTEEVRHGSSGSFAG